MQAKALAEKNQRDLQAQRDQDERHVSSSEKCDWLACYRLNYMRSFCCGTNCSLVLNTHLETNLSFGSYYFL